MGGCMGQWVGSGQMTNLIKLELINMIWFCLKIYNLSRRPYLWVDGCINGWAHVKPLKSNKSWPNRDNSIMDILDILLDILLKPPQPLMGLFFTPMCDSVHGGVSGRHPLGRHPTPPGQTPPRADIPLGTHTPQADTPFPSRRPLQRTVRILLGHTFKEMKMNVISVQISLFRLLPRIQWRNH